MSTEIDSFAPFDRADYLDTVEDVAAYLEPVIDEADDDPGAIARALGTITRSRNFSQIAQQGGLSREGLYKVHSADGNPHLAGLIKVAHALGLRLRFEPNKLGPNRSGPVLPTSPRTEQSS